MAKLVLTVPEGLFDSVEGKATLLKLQEDMESLSSGERKFMLLPSDDGWTIEVIEENSWEINCGEDTYS